MNTAPFQCFFTTDTPNGHGWQKHFAMQVSANSCIEVIDGGACPNITSFFHLLQEQLAIPDSIMSWDALEGHLAYAQTACEGDCWLIFTDSHLLLKDENPIQFKILNSVLNTSNRIREGKVQYKVIWQTLPEFAPTVQENLSRADFVLMPFHITEIKR